jgi:hypothetical protein
MCIPKDRIAITSQAVINPSLRLGKQKDDGAALWRRGRKSQRGFSALALRPIRFEKHKVSSIGKFFAIPNEAFPRGSLFW